jgi:hypothetical protein
VDAAEPVESPPWSTSTVVEHAAIATARTTMRADEHEVSLPFAAATLPSYRAPGDAVPRTPKPKPSPSWSDVKAKLADLDAPKLVNLIADLYAANADNRTFLHARFDVGEDPLAAYKKSILRGTAATRPST